jgi:hypothetical protein
VFNVRGLSSDEFFAESRARDGRFTQLQSTLARAASHVVLPFTFATRARSPVDVVRASFAKRTGGNARALSLAQVAADANSIVAADVDAVVVDVTVGEIDSLLTVLGQFEAAVGARPTVAMVVGSIDADAAATGVRRRQVDVPTADDNTTSAMATTTDVANTTMSGTATPTSAPGPTPTPTPTPNGDLAPLGMWDAIMTVALILLITACGFERLFALQTPTQFVQAPKKAKQN